LSQKQNLLVAEQGTADPNTGRISVIDPTNGVVRTLLDGLPSALNLVGGEPAPSGPSGLAIRGGTLYVTIGSGNTTLPGPLPGEEVPNPDVSSPLFSSVLEMYFSARVEQMTTGFMLTASDQLALKNGARLILNNGHGDQMVIKVLVDFPDYVPGPEEGFVVSSNPFGIVRGGDQLYVVDASLNLLATVESVTGATSVLTHFENVPNTLPFGPPTVQPVPDNIHFFGDQLLVPYLTGFPFGPGAAQVRTVNPTTGEDGPFVTELTAALDVLPLVGGRPAGQFLVLEFGGPGLVPPGRLLLFASPDATPTVIADCLTTPTSMVLDNRHGVLFITEIGTGKVLQISRQ
jgi:hypothetical protein